MTAYMPAPYYLRSPRVRKPRLLAFVLIAALHLGALALLMVARAPVPQAEQQPIMVTFIAAPPQPAPEPPTPPPEPVKPRPQPKMVATPRPSPSPIQVPPIEETPEAPAAVETPAPAPPAPLAEAPVIPPNFVAAYLNNPGPSYPQTSVRLREQGTVMLLVRVNAGGTADQVTVEKSSGFSRLDDAAVDVVKKRWKFVPAQQAGKPVAAWVRIPVAFELKRH